MPKPEPESAEVDLRNRNMSEVLEALRGGTVFVKKLRRTHVQRQGPSLPKRFVEENKAKLSRSVVLLTKTRAWSLRFAIVRQQRVVPEFVFCRGWRAFAVSNNLAIGDQLVFNLSAPSQFDVFIFNIDGTPKSKSMSKLPEMKIKHSSEIKLEHVVVEERKPSACGRSEYFIKKEIREPANDHEECSINRDRTAPRDTPKPHPNFVRRLTLSNFKHDRLEIPAKFVRTFGNRLQSPVKLQGVFEESAVCTVTSRREVHSPTGSRVFLEAGWRKFRNENMLEVEQELEFTLVSDSFFEVRERVNPL
ncbi:hypothetical protein M758_4G260800 [Ceratodon purpureus]|nr:hypothetical protein M758_4G260800 [Ceratodon purpureus]